MDLFAFSGSLRTGSFNTKLLALAVTQLRALGLTVDEWDFKAANVPVYDPDTSETNPAPGIVDFKARVRQATGVLIASPEYNYSLPGALKNLLDYASRPAQENPFRGKVAAQLGATPGPGGTLQAQVMLRHVLVGLQMYSVPGAFTVSRAADAFDEKGQLVDASQQKQLGSFLERVAFEVRLRAQAAR
jgi:chromate reductase, NAD(P)H dehydrogenase (quinone)